MSEFEKKVLEMLKSIDQKLDNLLGGAAPSLKPVTVPKEVLPETTKPAASSVKPSKVASSQGDTEKPQEEQPAAEGRRVCPDCGSTEFNQIEDRSKILHYMGGMKIYAKKHVCRKCGYEM